MIEAERGVPKNTVFFHLIRDFYIFGMWVVPKALLRLIDVRNCGNLVISGRRYIDDN
jgi:hypothetical protein